MAHAGDLDRIFDFEIKEYTVVASERESGSTITCSKLRTAANFSTGNISSSVCAC